MSRPQWPRSFVGRALVILVLVATLSLLVAGGMVLADAASARQAATVASVTTLIGGPLLALVGATVIRGGRPLRWDPDWSGVIASDERHADREGGDEQVVDDM